ncbi:MAG: hypothetical protein ACI9G9_000105 [Psychromonas sp.]|jgi:hypothetical protein
MTAFIGLDAACGGQKRCLPIVLQTLGQLTSNFGFIRQNYPLQIFDNLEDVQVWITQNNNSVN